MTKLRAVRVFIASPGDVDDERQCVERVVLGLNREFADIAQFTSILWEQRFYTADRTFQDQIVEPAECDVVIVIFGGKLGSEMAPEFVPRLRDGSPYPSGTAYELLSSLDAADATGRPDVYVFRKTDGEKFDISQRAQYETAIREADRLEAFFQKWFRTPSGGFRRAFHWFRSTDEFADRVSPLLLEWAEHALALPPTWRIDHDGSPFRGLEPFDAKHSRVFFGRSRKVQRAVEELLRAAGREQRRPFLLIVGPSGSGKSSLMRAGLVPRLTAPGVVPKVDRWRVAVMRPGGDATPFMALARALYVTAEEDEKAGGFGPALPELAAGPYKSPEQLAEVLEIARPSAAAPLLAALDAVGEAERRAGGFDRTMRADLLVLVDQLEEIFATDVSDADRLGFARLMTVLVDSGRVWIVATLRADLYVRMLDPHLPFLALKDSGGQYDLASPGAAELTEILEKSAEAAGLEYEKDPDSGERLDERLLLDASGADTLPLLEFSLKQLYERREIKPSHDGPRTYLTFDAYRKLEGLDGAIDQVAEAAITDPANQLGPHEIDEALPRLLRRLAVPVRHAQSQTESRAALTVRPARLDEATPDDASRRLVEVLVRARLLVSDSPSHDSASLRLAHERVLSSWKRASKIVDEHRDFYRITDDVEIERGRWEAGGKRSPLLLAGAPLADTEQILRRYGSELPQGTRDYIVLSGRRARLRQRLVAAAAVMFFCVAVVATGFALVAVSAEQRATANYQAAKAAADQLVSAIPKQLRNKEGIPTQTLTNVLGVVNNLIDGIQGALRQPPGAAARWGIWAIDVAHLPFSGTRATAEDIAQLDRSRADMLYEFAETYHQSANDQKQAMERATQSLQLRERLRDAGDRTPDLMVEIAASHMELGDLLRGAIDNGSRNGPKDYGEPRRDYLAALAILRALAARPPAGSADAGTARRRDVDLGLTNVLTRLGDLELKYAGEAKGASKADHARSAEAYYAELSRIAWGMFRAYGDNTVSTREVAWAYRKEGQLAEFQQTYPAAVTDYRTEVCVHRHLMAIDQDDTRLIVDLSYSLFRLGGARSNLQPPDTGGARDAYYEAMSLLRPLFENDPDNAFDWINYAASLEAVADLYRQIGNKSLELAFAKAAADKFDEITRLFPKSDVSRQHGLAVRELADARSRFGDGAQQYLDTQSAMVDLEQDGFIARRLADVRALDAGCWDRLLQTVGPTTAH